MKRILRMSILSLFMTIVVHQGQALAEDTGYPAWINELHSLIDRSFHIRSDLSLCKEPDRREQGKYFSFCLQGNGKLEKVPDPSGEMDNVFLTYGWRPDERYQADGHGSSSFAYGKEHYLCLVSVAIDSSCDDEEDGHVPSEFWFSISCREKEKAIGGDSP